MCSPDVSVAELPLDLIPLDNDILSLELPEFFTDYFLVGTFIHFDTNLVYNITALYRTHAQGIRVYIGPGWRLASF